MGVKENTTRITLQFNKYEVGLERLAGLLP